MIMKGHEWNGGLTSQILIYDVTPEMEKNKSITLNETIHHKHELKRDIRNTVVKKRDRVSSATDGM